MNQSRQALPIKRCSVVAVAGLLVACGSGTATNPQTSALGLMPAPTTPTGITLIEVVREMQASQPEYLWTRLGDAQGNTLFISDADDHPGVSNCNGDCSKDFPPVRAPADARAFGDWSIVPRADGSRQWAYLGKPLYTFAKETRLNEVIDNIVTEESKAQHLPKYQYDSRANEKNPLMPPTGWNVARFDPAPKLVKPDEIGLKRVVVQDGVGPALVDGRGMTLYVYDGTAEQAVAAECIAVTAAHGCSATFQPALAPDAAVSRIGDFSVVVRKNDHVRQWAYRGLPLYTFSGDSKSGDTLGVYGSNTDGWQVMMLSIDPFPENVQAIKAVGRGTVLADNSSMPLYVVARYDDRWGGFNAYNGYSNAYRMGKMLGTNGCNAECLQMRHPLLATAADQSRGYWEVFDRGDGTRQWAYKGFALYSYAGDKQAGVVSGGNVLQLLLGDNSGHMGLGADEFGPNGPSSIASSTELAKGYSTASLQVVKGYSLATLKEGEVDADQSKLAAFYWYVARP